MNEDDRVVLFPELTGSYKIVLVMQMLACYVLVAVIWSQFGWLWGAVAFALDTLKDCFVVTAMIQQSRANAISLEVQRKRQERNALFTENEGRLLSRGGLDDNPPTLEVPDGQSWHS